MPTCKGLCSNDLPESSFYRYPSGILESKCKRCRQPNRKRPGYSTQAMRQWRRANPDKARLARASYRARKRGAEFELEHMAIVLRDPCAYCDRPANSVDHITPISKGGDGSWENLAGVCAQCNTSKNNTPMLLWLATKV